MNAVVIDKYGEANVLKMKSIPIPVPGPWELLVEVRACGLNPVDFKIRAGHLQDLFAVKFPRILDGDISGVVKSLGPEVTDFRIGDEVYFSNPLDRDGGYTEFCAVDHRIVAKKPATISHEEAACDNVAEQRVIKTISEMRNDCISFRKIEKFLTGAGVPTKTRRKKWHPEVVRQIYLNHQ